MPRKSPNRRSRCPHGRKKTDRHGCKSKPGPKKSSRSSRSRRCLHGRKQSGACKSKPGPKKSRRRSRRSSRSRRSKCHHGRKKSGACKSKPGPKKSRRARRSRRSRRSGRSKSWTNSVKMARKKLKMKGFVAIGGRSREGKRLLAEARKIHGN